MGPRVITDLEKGAERKVRVEDPNGGKRCYKGKNGAERLVRSELSDVEQHFFEGEKGT